ncbi:MAG TPA: LPS assembly protein LptD [Nitrospiraceae bacterium]|nr:LPS assembly protein LptD [Nitrospiraceae bacterium]
MGSGLSTVCRSFLLSVLVLFAVGAEAALAAKDEASQSVSVKPPAPASQPIAITADHLEYLQNVDVYEADGSVVVLQGPLRLTADHITLMMLTGTMVATGHVHLTDPNTDLKAERLELDVNTDAGVVTDSKLYLKESNTLITGRILQRFSESHYRAKDGSFTNCDAQGQTPAWRFTFEDFDLNVGDGIYGRKVWFCINDQPVLRLPSMFYPIQTTRKTGLLIPTIGYDNRFGVHYRQGFFWAINPSQDLTITPDFLSNRGYGGDLEYRYALDRLSRGQWLVSYIQDTVAKQARALIGGTHRQQITPDLKINAQVFYLTDPNYLNDLSNSGVQRALPSGESYLNINQRFATGNLYLLGQYLQPLQAGGKDTFQRLPEIGYRMINVAPFNGPLLLGMDSSFVNFYREQGFTLSRVDVVPSIGTEVLSFGHVAGLTPQVKLREVYYTNNVQASGSAHRETFWAGLEGVSRLSRRFRLTDGRSVLHTIEPKVVYEYVPQTDQSDIVQIDNVDFLPKKNLITYSLSSRLLEQGSGGLPNSWLDLLIAQSYHPGSTPNRTTFTFSETPLFGSVTQPLQLPSVPTHVDKFSNIWTRMVIGNPVSFIRGVDKVLVIDAFLDPYRGTFSQWNTDLRFQYQKEWYVEVGQRFAREGNRPRRGDIWNPISFNEVYAPTPEIQFVTLAGAFKGPLGLTFGAKTYYDVKRGTASETDVVALYRNPCQCWSLGLYYIQFPDRAQYNFMISLTGIGATENYGTQIMKYLLGPLVIGERGLPWPSPYGARTTAAPRRIEESGP